MANEKHLNLIKQDVEAWNKWRRKHPGIRPELHEAILRGAGLNGADLSGADLSRADLRDASLRGAALLGADLSNTNLNCADLSGADLRQAQLYESDLRRAYLTSANLAGADLHKSNLSRADLLSAQLIRSNLDEANLSEANLSAASFYQTRLRGADLQDASLHMAIFSLADLHQAKLNRAILIGTNLNSSNLQEANLSQAILHSADLGRADLNGANLSGADLTGSSLVEADLRDANLNGCRIYGISVWDLKVNRKTKQSNLIITRTDQVEVTVDDLEVAQFIYLLLNRKKLRNVLNTITSKAVLLLGRFTPERKAVLEALAGELRKNRLLPIIFDFERSTNRDFTETIKILAGLSLFVIVDITKPKSAPQELTAIVPDYQIPFVPILEEGEEPYSMFEDFKKYDWVLKPVLKYRTKEVLLRNFHDVILEPAWKKHLELQRKKNAKLQAISIEDMIARKKTLFGEP